jgi:type VI secretion system secreted protein VgrG
MDKTMPATSERIELVTPLGEELLFHGMLAREELSQLGEYQLDVLSKNREVDRDQILGAKVAIKVMLQNDETRYFNGFVTQFGAGASLGRYARYHAVVSPWLWFLTRTADCRIFQDMTVRQIVEEVFADHPEVADFAFELTESYQPWKYCVQYRETDFNFVSRLLEHEGMYYYFRHTDGHHTMVITDSMDKHEPTPGYEKLQYVAPQALVRPGTEYISEWHVSREVQPGVYVHDDYDFARPGVDLTTTRTLPRGYTPSQYEVYDYPGCYLQKPDGERWAHVRIDEYGSKFEKYHASTNYRGIQTGAKFALEGAGDKFNGDYLVIGATHTLESSEYESSEGAENGSSFRCSFTALSCSQQFRPPRVTPKPFVQGPQTAIVVGPAGDEIYTDNYGRVKVQFHWDRRGNNDENSSCWMRVSQPWAGKGWGSVSTPRIGQEVIVDFLEGDPDQPIVTGRVYNEECQPPFGFPAGAVSSGIKSQTHKGAGYNELSMDDTAGKEKVTIHGQYDMNTTVGNNQTNAVGVDQSNKVGSNQKEEIGANRELSITANDKVTIGGNRETSITGNHTFTVGGAEDASVKGARKSVVGGKEDVSIGAASTLQVGGSRSETIKTTHSIVNLTMTITTATQFAASAGSQFTATSPKVNVLAGSKLLVNSGGKADIKSGGPLTQQSGAAMNIKSGANLNLQSSSPMNLKAGAGLNAQAGAAMNLKAGGTLNAKGSSIKLNSPTNIKGTTLTIK